MRLESIKSTISKQDTDFHARYTMVVTYLKQTVAEADKAPSVSTSYKMERLTELALQQACDFVRVYGARLPDPMFHGLLYLTGTASRKLFGWRIDPHLQHTYLDKHDRTAAIRCIEHVGLAPPLERSMNARHRMARRDLAICECFVRLCEV